MNYNMDIISTLRNVLKDLIAKRTSLHNKIIKEKTLVQEHNLRLKELKEEIDAITNNIKISEEELENINRTIEQTENGYKKILEAGETLMMVVSENIEQYKHIK